MKKVLAIVCLGAIIVFGSCRRETKDEKFKRDFEQFTEKECPKFIDPYTRLDSAIYDIESRTLSYYYSVCKELDNDILYTVEVISDFHDNVLKELKSSIQLKGYKDEGVTFHYDYRSATTGKMMLDLTFTKEDYGK